MPTEAQWAYAAGLVDGEGCISIARGRRGKARYWYYFPLVRVSQNECGMPVLFWLREAFGGYICVVNRYSEKYKRQSYAWAVSARMTGPFLNGILPFLVLKSAQAQLALEFLECRSKAMSSRRVKNEAVIEAEHILYEASHKLNQHVTML